MSLQDDVDMINAYTQWKVTRGDTSPETFVRERAKEEALDRLERVVSWLDNYLDDGTGDYDYKAGVEMITTNDLKHIVKLTRGEAE